MTVQQRQLGIAAIRIGRAFGVGGTTWSSVSPVYIVQEQPTRLEIALAAPEIPRARWRFIAKTATVAAWVMEQTITNGGGLTFRITALDSVGIPGLTLGLLEQIR